MKKMMMIMVMMTAIAASTNAMTYSEARNEALFLTDKMAYELALSDRQYEMVYEINLDYMMDLSSRSSLYGTAWSRRNTDLMYVLTARQYDLYAAANYFYRPVDWYNNGFRFVVYNIYTDRGRYYRSHPAAYASYKGGMRKDYSKVSWRNHGNDKPSGNVWSSGVSKHSGNVKPSGSNRPGAGGRSFGGAPAKVTAKTNTFGNR